ncbi:MAG: TadZ/CpaE-like protein [Betaproteobacteria bacterium]|nr:TadZ/CpaE-like protein [Betaproteobacteria bacterium]
MKRKQNGVALVEFALVLPFLLLMTFIVVEYSRALYQYNTLTKSVRDAARYLSVQSPGSNISQAKNLVVYGNPAGTGTPLTLGLTTAQVPNPVWTFAGAGPVINTVTVTITGYRFVPIFASAFGVNFGNITYNNISATMRAPL